MSAGRGDNGGHEMWIVDLPAGHGAWERALPVLQELRPHVTADVMAQLLQRAASQGLQFMAVLDLRGRCLGVAGWRVVDNTSAGRKLYIDDLVTTASARSGGVGALLLAELRLRGREAGCRLMELDSGVSKFAAHRFYLRERFDITAHHFSTSL